MPYIGKSPTGSGVRQRYHYTATGGETSLSGADDNSKTLKFTDGEYVDVYLNGVLLVQGTDYGVGTANTISSLAALAANDIVEVIVYDVFNVAKINSEAVRTRHYFTASGGETSIGTSQIGGLSFAANEEIDVMLNGVSLVAGTDYNTSSANTVGGLSALTAGQVVEIVIYEKFQLADVVSKAAGGTYSGQIIADGGLDMNGKELILDADADSKIEVGTDDTMTFSVANSEAMRINPQGHLFLGTTSTFDGNIYQLEINQVTNRGILLHTTGTSTNYAMIFQNDNGSVGSISTNGSATTFTTSSDYRLKENVTDLTGATNRLKQLNPVRFNFIADADTTVDGFLAHEVQTIVPEAVVGTKDATENYEDENGNEQTRIVPQGIDQSKLVPLLVATIQELEARIAALEAE